MPKPINNAGKYDELERHLAEWCRRQREEAADTAEAADAIEDPSAPDEPADEDPATAYRNLGTSRAVEAQVEDVDETKRIVVATVNDDTVDRYNTVILPSGLDLRQYQANPVLLWCHYMEAAPLGRCIWIAKRDGKSKTKAKFQFDDDPFSDLIFRKYQAGSMRAFSIRFDPDYEYASMATAEEIKANAKWKDAWIYRKSTLLEVSAVAVPGNANCLAEDVSRGLITRIPEDVKEAIRTLSLGGGASLPTGEILNNADPEEASPAALLPSLSGARSFDQVATAMLRKMKPAEIQQLARAEYQNIIDRARGRV